SIATTVDSASAEISNLHQRTPATLNSDELAQNPETSNHDIASEKEISSSEVQVTREVTVVTVVETTTTQESVVKEGPKSRPPFKKPGNLVAASSNVNPDSIRSAPTFTSYEVSSVTPKTTDVFGEVLAINESISHEGTNRTAALQTTGSPGRESSPVADFSTAPIVQPSQVADASFADSSTFEQVTNLEPQIQSDIDMKDTSATDVTVSSDTNIVDSISPVTESIVPNAESISAPTVTSTTESLTEGIQPDAIEESVVAENSDDIIATYSSARVVTGPKLTENVLVSPLPQEKASSLPPTGTRYGGVNSKNNVEEVDGEEDEEEEEERILVYPAAPWGSATKRRFTPSDRIITRMLLEKFHNQDEESSQGSRRLRKRTVKRQRVSQTYRATSDISTDTIVDSDTVTGEQVPQSKQQSSSSRESRILARTHLKEALSQQIQVASTEALTATRSSKRALGRGKSQQLLKGRSSNSELSLFSAVELPSVSRHNSSSIFRDSKESPTVMPYDPSFDEEVLRLCKRLKRPMEVVWAVEIPQRAAYDNTGSSNANGSVSQPGLDTTDAGFKPGSPDSWSSPKTFNGWWIEAIVLANQQDLAVHVHGYIPQVWHSSRIVRIESPRVVKTKSGGEYHLMGDLDVLQMDNNFFDPEVIQSFKDGFPPNWEATLKKWAFKDMSPEVHIGEDNDEIDSSTSNLPEEEIDGLDSSSASEDVVVKRASRRMDAREKKLLEDEDMSLDEHAVLEGDDCISPLVGNRRGYHELDDDYVGRVDSQSRNENALRRSSRAIMKRPVQSTEIPLEVLNDSTKVGRSRGISEDEEWNPPKYLRRKGTSFNAKSGSVKTPEKQSATREKEGKRQILSAIELPRVTLEAIVLPKVPKKRKNLS
ncbi:hypothetical protein BGZ94_002239, partial [Podila epigama]